MQIKMPNEITPEFVQALIESNIRLAAENEMLKKKITVLEDRITELESQLNKNSHNSSKPYAKPAPKSLRGKSGKKPGGQNGHNGSGFKLMKVPDEIVTHMSEKCAGCPHAEECQSHAHIEETRYEVDINVEVKVTAHKVLSCKENFTSRGEDAFPKNQLDDFHAEYDRLIREGFDQNPMPAEMNEKKRGRKKEGKVRALLHRLEKYSKAVCLFADDFSIPFDNNQAERDIRMVKVKQKVSGCFRALDGARNFAGTMAYIGTAKKQGVCAFSAIKDALCGHVRIFLSPTTE